MVTSGSVVSAVERVVQEMVYVLEIQVEFASTESMGNPVRKRRPSGQRVPDLSIMKQALVPVENGGHHRY